MILQLSKSYACSLASANINLSSDLSSLFAMAFTILALSDSMITLPCAHCVAKRTPSAHACASASSALAHLHKTRHAVNIPCNHPNSCSSCMFNIRTIYVDFSPSCRSRFPCFLLYGLPRFIVVPLALLSDVQQLSFPFEDMAVPDFLLFLIDHSRMFSKK